MVETTEARGTISSRNYRISLALDEMHPLYADNGSCSRSPLSHRSPLASMGKVPGTPIYEQVPVKREAVLKLARRSSGGRIASSRLFGVTAWGAPDYDIRPGGRFPGARQFECGTRISECGMRAAGVPQKTPIRTVSGTSFSGPCMMRFEAVGAQSG